MAEMYICSSCGYVIDERLHPAPDIGVTALPEGFGKKPSCPVCGADKVLFKPCACAPMPGAHHRKAGREIHRLAKLAEYEAHLCESNRFLKMPLTRQAAPFTRLLHEMHVGSEDEEIPEPADFVDDSAYDLLLAYSGNYYWFCRILASAASRGGRLPLKSEQIGRAIQDIVSQLGTEFIDTRPLRDFPHWQTAMGVVRGALLLEPIQDGTYRLDVNSAYDYRPRIVSATLLSSADLKS